MSEKARTGLLATRSSHPTIRKREADESNNEING
jgi:hypothetical protein